MISRTPSVRSLSVCASLALVLALLLPAVTYAQLVRIARIGVLSAGPPPSPTAPAPPTREALLRGLRELGWIEGQNIAFEYRYAAWQVERLPDLAGELVRANVDVIFTGGYRPVLAARDATRSIPIVVHTCDPVETLIGSLARPGGNMTGSTCLSAELSPKKLQFLKETVPGATRIAVLFNPDDPGPTLGMKLMQEAAPRLQVKLQPVSVRADADGRFNRSLQHLKRGDVQWDDPRGGQPNGQGERRCSRQVARKSINGLPSGHSGNALRRAHRARTRHEPVGFLSR